MRIKWDDTWRVIVYRKHSTVMKKTGNEAAEAKRVINFLQMKV